ncbi:hypothetical protein M3Y99_01813900 [Aphelenchoides fujianensis]|nr:hypothetical protein M3Y99_01813900 [Aphelenchoides fujianensis]
MLLAAVSVWMNAFGRWDTWASCFFLLSTKAVAWSAVAIPFFPPLFLALLAPLGFCIAAEQSLILDLAVRRIPNPAKKLLIPAGCLASRVLFLTFASKFPVMFWLGCAMLMCGVAICGLGFEPTKSVASAFFGNGRASVHPLLVGMIGSSLVSPLAMTQVVQTYGPELFTSFNLFAVFLMVCLFVGLLNVQSSTERPPDEKHARVWIFFQGQGMKRTRSIRKFIGSLRGSLRGSRYRRLRRHQRSPLPPADSSLLGPNPIATRSYRSTESARRQRKSLLEANPPRHNSLDREEETQIDCLSPTTPSPVFFSNPNHTSTH